MPTPEAVARGLVELRTWWPSMPDTPVLLAAVVEDCAGYDDAEFDAAIRKVRREHKAGWPPKPADILAACGAIAKVRRAPATLDRRMEESDAYCSFCHTRELEDYGFALPNGLRRMRPRHRSDCLTMTRTSPTRHDKE